MSKDPTRIYDEDMGDGVRLLSTFMNIVYRRMQYVGVCSGTLFVGPGRAGPGQTISSGRAGPVSEQQSAYKECHIYILEIRIL